MSNPPGPINNGNLPESPSLYIDLAAEKKRIFLPVCRETSHALLVSEATIRNQTRQLTQLEKYNPEDYAPFPCPFSLVVFIEGGSELSQNQTSARLSWTLTFASTSSYNRSGSLASYFPRTSLCAKQEAILALLDFLKSDDVDIMLRRVIIVACDEESMARMVTWLEDDACSDYFNPAPDVLTEEGRTEVISIRIRRLCSSKGWDIKFWLVTSTQIVKPT
ncbi:hypothetical protein CDV36_006016 [Fusarium kuroshium]|uniref:RNase H type-1 domain-containing protein n=1 Tax=Fusarium kuroshium TaxID=2010991 RepID=A0A3M2SAQ7_9HYPO|nr:hypothetical protein CDV36_006016 [Fusarium kuroshium]